MTSPLQKQDFILPILVSKESQRQSYIFDLIFKEIIGIEYVLVDKSFEGSVLKYGFESGFWSHGYLDQISIEMPNFENGQFEGKILPFFGATAFHETPFDIFATCFYFVTRHEELDLKEVDQHGRFLAENSWLIQNGWQYEPIVNYLAFWLSSWIEKEFNLFLPKKSNYRVRPTLDIDNAYAFYGRKKSIVFSAFKSILEGKIDDAKLKLRSAKEKEIDPFNTHKSIIKQFDTYEAKPTIFFLMKEGGNNSNNRIELVQEIVRLYIENGFALGLHPSYRSVLDSITSEKKLLESFAQENINKSRHHFIKINPHADYPQLAKIGVQREYSMGFANTVGFRAGICNPYNWFDLNENKPIDLTVVPFYFMDATYIFKLKYTPLEALDSIKRIVERVRKYRGNLSFIFHNESVSDYGVYKGWGDFLGKTMKVV